MRLDLFVKFKYQLSTIILFVGIRYFVRDLLSDLNNYAWAANQRYASDTVNDVSASSGVSSSQKAVNSIPKQSFRCSFMLKFLLFSYFLNFFLVFKHDFIRCVDFIRIAVSEQSIAVSEQSLTPHSTQYRSFRRYRSFTN